MLDNEGNLYLNNLNGLATRAIADSKGNNIVNTYATKDEVEQAGSNTTYTFATGDNNGQIKVTPSDGTA